MRRYVRGVIDNGSVVMDSALCVACGHASGAVVDNMEPSAELLLLVASGHLPHSRAFAS